MTQDPSLSGDTPDLRRSPLHGLHVELGGRMVPFAGWELPVQYPAGVLAEHLHCRAGAALFDVSHMGQVILRSADGTAKSAALVLERLVPADLAGLPEGRQRYGLFTDENGGILDDLMIANRGDHLFVVVNAARVDHDLAHMRSLDGVEVTFIEDRALMALQGPEAESALSTLIPEVKDMRFMDVRVLTWKGAELWVSRSGYTGEDGFEISVPAAHAEEFARSLLDITEVMPAGLGARDSLRLEAGMPLYGQDIGPETTPASAGLGWSVSKARRAGGEREGGFPGAAVILAEIADGAAGHRVGLRPEGRAPIRNGVALFASEDDPAPIGMVASGGFGPTVAGPIATAIIPKSFAIGTRIWADLRGRRVPATIVALPFVSPSYKR